MQSPKGPADDPCPGCKMTGSPVFAAFGRAYARYRLAYPDRLVKRVATLAGLGPGAAVLDLGTGTGMLAVALARLGMTVTAMDPDPAMLAEADMAARGAGVRLTLVEGGSAGLAADMGPFHLVTIGRAFHWMDRAATLAMLDRVVVPGGGVALFHDAHPPVAENEWFKLVHAVQARHARAGNEGRQGRGGHRRYEPFLFASGFSQIDGLSVTVRRPIDMDEIVGRALTLSQCTPVRLGAGRDAFVQDLRTGLMRLSPDGCFMEVAEMVAVLARRPSS